ncbi:MAG: amidohydrolase [Lentisphaeria bacterium]|nr:amidohydrolase [Lentisphaeria bacterium]
MRYWIVNGNIHTAVTPEVLQADILIENGKIAAIGKAPEGEPCVDVKGLEVYPGLVEAHCHLGLDGYAVKYEGHDYNELNDCVTPELNAVDGFNPMDQTLENARKGGVTCVGAGPGSSNVLGGTFAAVKTSGICVDDMIVKEKVAMKCAFGENPKNCYRSKSITSRMTTAAKLREALFKAREYMRKIEKAGDDDSKKPDFNFRNEALLPVLRGEIPLKAHAHQANDILTAIRIAREFGVKLTLEHCNEGHLIAEILGKYPYPVAVGPTLSHSTKPELRYKSFETPGILSRAGCHVSIITDSPVIPQEHLALVAGLAVRAGMDPFAALKAITIHPAEHLGIADRVGSVEVGKDADLVICDGDILSSMTHILKVYIDGNEVSA